jgi:hypothetical protein
MTDETAAAPDAPQPEVWAICEIMGHQILVGRVKEVAQFGVEFLQIEPIFDGKLLSPVLQSPASLFRFTPCTEEQARRHAPKKHYQLPEPVRAANGLVPAAREPAMLTDAVAAHDPDDFGF